MIHGIQIIHVSINQVSDNLFNSHRMRFVVLAHTLPKLIKVREKNLEANTLAKDKKSQYRL